MRTWEVIEDNGGGLYLFVWEDNELIYGSSDFEYDLEGLRASVIDLTSLDSSYNIDDWELNLPEGVTIQDLYDNLTNHDYGWNTVACGSELEAEFYYDKMGNSAGNAFPRTVVWYETKNNIVMGELPLIESTDLELSNEELVDMALLEVKSQADEGHFFVDNGYFSVLNICGFEEQRSFIFYP